MRILRVSKNLKNMKKVKTSQKVDLSNDINGIKRQITIRLDEEAISYFKEMAEQTGIPYQNLINLYLKDCADNNKKLNLSWS